MALVATSFFDSVKMIAAEKGIPEEEVFKAVEESLVKAAEKYFQGFDFYGNFQAQMDRETGEFHVYALKQVVPVVEEEDLEISLEEAQALNPDAAEGDTLWLPQDTSQLGRIAAQAAKQVLVQKVREAERDRIFTDFADRIGEVVVGEVKRFEKSAIILEVDRVEAMLRRSEALRGDRFDKGQRIKVVISAVDKSAKDPQVQVSRTDPRLLIKLFDQEVPEIHDGTVVIRSCVREAGDRAKVAVHSLDPDVDPVGACVGLKGSRVQAIIRELKNEKIDIVRYDDDNSRYIANALNPAKALRVTVTDPEHRRVEVVVDDEQLSIAIGKRGQNVRLAAKLTGWNIDVRSEAEKRKDTEAAMGQALAAPAFTEEVRPQSRLLEELGPIEGLTEELVENLANAGHLDAKSLYTVTVEQLLAIEGMDQDLAIRLIDAVHDRFGE
ncbi:transcription termination factor NusA [Mesoterricola sediminis]|uniref:Transcription termination/antitermination protein NusA n=1 Tax=Mesoterricola sediminis TaxID=2927980 RepID=A0AA48GST1_9BACT|nr:transcription termination factor NusA [Mesoterricola sediminis]BDU78611.1 transcription termination/antitermination protein NusA [Mesoterricola sediminis]